MELKPFGVLFKNSWEMYKARISTLAMLMILPFIANALYVVSLRKTEVIVHGVTKTVYQSGSASLLIGLILLVLTLWVQVAVTHVADSKEDSLDVSKLLSKSSGMILPLALVSILAGLAVVGGLILLIVPGIIFAIWFAFSAFTLILENKRGTEALKASKALVVGRWGAVFSRIILLALSVLGISILVSIILSIFPYKIHTILSAGLSAFFVSPIATIFSYLLYKELKAKKAAPSAA